MKIKAKGTLVNGRLTLEAWLWWPITVKLAFDRGSLTPWWRYSFTQGGISHRDDFYPYGSLNVVTRCWNIGPICIIFGNDERARHALAEFRRLFESHA